MLLVLALGFLHERRMSTLRRLPGPQIFYPYACGSPFLSWFLCQHEPQRATNLAPTLKPACFLQ